MKKGIIPGSMWKIVFWLSWLVLGAVSYLVGPALWGLVESSTGPKVAKWIPYLQQFPLSLFLSLQVWIGYRAFGEPTGEGHRGWKIAFWVNCIPSCFFYVFSVIFARDIHLQPMLGLALLIVWIPASLLLVSQVVFAIFAFRR